MDVTVDHVAALEESDLLKVDYTTALEKFRRVSKLKQALERRPPIRRMTFQMKVPAARAALVPPARLAFNLEGCAFGTHAAANFHGRNQAAPG